MTTRDTGADSTADIGSDGAPDRAGRALVFLPALVAVAVTAPLLADPLALVGPDTFRSHDWLESAKLDAFTRDAMLRWHTLPHWNPWLQGGLPQLTHPSDGSLSPFVLPSLLLGPAVGMKLSAVLALVLGAVGVGLLGRDRCGLRPTFAAFAGSAFAVAGWVPSRMMIGYYESCLYAYFPMVAWLLLTADRRHPGRAVLATLGVAVAALQLHLGLLVLLLFLTVLVAMEVIQGSLPRRALALLAGVGAGGGALAAAKLWPMLAYLRGLGFRAVAEYPVAWGDQWYGSLTTYLGCALRGVPLLASYRADGLTVQADFGYIGLGLPLLLLLAVAIARLHRLSPGLRATFVLGLLCSWLCFGPNAFVDGFHALWQLPGFHSMRGSVRYLSFGLAWAGCLLAAGGLQIVFGPARRVRLQYLGLVVALATLAWPAWESGRRYAAAFTARVDPGEAPGEVFVQDEIDGGEGQGYARGGSPDRDEGNLLVYRNLRRGVGTIYAPADLPADPRPAGRRIYVVAEGGYVDNPAYRGEVWCAEHSCAATVDEVWAGGFRLSAAPLTADTLVLNQAYHPGWSAEPGSVVDHDGLVGVALDGSGPVTVGLRFETPGFRPGVAISACALAALLAAAWLVRRRSLASPTRLPV